MITTGLAGLYFIQGIYVNTYVSAPPIIFGVNTSKGTFQHSQQFTVLTLTSLWEFTNSVMY